MPHSDTPVRRCRCPPAGPRFAGDVQRAARHTEAREVSRRVRCGVLVLSPRQLIGQADLERVLGAADAIVSGV